MAQKKKKINQLTRELEARRAASEARMAERQVEHQRVLASLDALTATMSPESKTKTPEQLKAIRAAIQAARNTIRTAFQKEVQS